MNEKTLAALVSDFVQSTPSETIQLVVNALMNWDPVYAELSKLNILSSIHNPDIKTKLSKLMDAWLLEHPQLPAQGFALAIQSSFLTYGTKQKPSVELVWTGPGMSYPVRRTDQALLELISGAKHQLVLVSFAVYKAYSILDAIENALRRNVEVIICLEDSDESQGKVTFSGSQAFASSIFRLASFFCWPIEKRSKTSDGKFGSLHAKVAVADGERAFISSANLTDYAMEMNIEMGVMINGGDLPQQVDKLFRDLIILGIFERVNL